jgi:hypothetical protein
MKRLFILIIFLLSQTVYSQSTEEVKKYIDTIIVNSKVDLTDLTALELLNDLYEETLQSDSGIISQNTTLRIEDFLKNKNSKNTHLLIMVLAYQDYIGHCAMTRTPPDTKFQVYLISKTETEISKVYTRTPAVIFIYKAEALNSDSQFENAKGVVKDGLKAYPNSVPLKVYEFLNTNDDKVKADLLLNHANHWMVQQFRIR